MVKQSKNQTTSINGDIANKIVGVECYKCKQSPFGAYKRKDWCLYLHSKCAYCGLENAVHWKWESNPEKKNEF